MDDFSFFIKQGLSHISDIGAYDHILFIVALAATYTFRQWRSLFWLVTAFTIGHSIALALATFELIKSNTALVEFLIPISIITTCLWNLFERQKESRLGRQLDHSKKKKIGEEFHVEQTYRFKYAIVAFFGLIHGLGFSSYLRFILDSDEGIFTPLLAFNLGLEAGQILILSIVLIINFVFLDLVKIEKKNWASFVSILVLLISIPIAVETGKILFIEG